MGWRTRLLRFFDPAGQAFDAAENELREVRTAVLSLQAEVIETMNTKEVRRVAAAVAKKVKQ